MAWCDYCKSEKPGWISVKTRLPRIDQTVMVCYPSAYDGKPIYAFGGRVDGGEGWCWGIKQGYGGVTPGGDAYENDVEVDDDYPVSHWKPLEKPPFRKPKPKSAEIVPIATAISR